MFRLSIRLSSTVFVTILTSKKWWIKRLRISEKIAKHFNTGVTCDLRPFPSHGREREISVNSRSTLELTAESECVVSSTERRAQGRFVWIEFYNTLDHFYMIC